MRSGLVVALVALTACSSSSVSSEVSSGTAEVATTVDVVGPGTSVPPTSEAPQPEVAPLNLIEMPDPSPLEVCEIPDPREKGEGDQLPNTGFPVSLDNLPREGTIRVVVVPVHWLTYWGEPAALEAEFAQVRRFVEFYETVSQGALQFEVDLVDDWTLVPGTPGDYGQERESWFNEKLTQAAVNAVDDVIDFSGTDILIVVIPDSSPIPSGGSIFYEGGAVNHASFQGFDTTTQGQRVESDEGQIPNWMGAGQYFDDPTDVRQEWAYYVHETGHMFELPDYYVVGEEKQWYSPRPDLEEVNIPSGPFNHWSIMGNQDGPSRTMNAWSRWLIGWMDDRVLCFDARGNGLGEFDVELIPLDVYSEGYKAVIVRTGELTGFVVESRRPIGPDETLTAWEENSGVEPRGPIVYRVDLAYGNHEAPLRIVPADGRFFEEWFWSDRTPGRHLDALFRVGDSAVVDGVTVTARQVAEAGDVVRLSMLGS